MQRQVKAYKSGDSLAKLFYNLSTLLLCFESVTLLGMELPSQKSNECIYVRIYAA